jgi:hypothetical protein
VAKKEMVFTIITAKGEKQYLILGLEIRVIRFIRFRGK